jgi:hypothetical protein
MRELANTLADIIQPDRDFLRRMLSEDVLTTEQYDALVNKSTIHKKNSKLLRYLENVCNGNCDEMLKIFDESGQKHVANFIRSGGGVL